MTKEEAIKLAESKWWEDKSKEEIAWFCVSTKLLCCPFEVMHEAIEFWLGRPVWTHELADTETLVQEKLGLRSFEGPIASAQRIAPDKPIIVV